MSARAKTRVLARALSSDARWLTRALASPRAAHSAHAFDDTLEFIRALDSACSAEERTAHELSRAVALGGRLLVRELDGGGMREVAGRRGGGGDGFALPSPSRASSESGSEALAPRGPRSPSPSSSPMTPKRELGMRNSDVRRSSSGNRFFPPGRAAVGGPENGCPDRCKFLY